MRRARLATVRGRVASSRATHCAQALVAVGIASAAVAGCGDGGNAAEPPAPSGQPDRIVVAVGSQPRTLDPALALSNSEQIIASAIQTPLLTFSRQTGDNASRLEPALARDLPRLTSDRLEYRFTLRPGLVYADGRLVNASDVERAIAHASKVAADPGVRDVLSGVIGAPSTDGETLRGVRTDDRNGAVVVRLRKPDGRLPLVLADPATAPLPEIPTDDPKALPASTGPLRVARITDDSVELVANPLRARIDTVPAARTAQISLLGRRAASRDLSGGAVGVALSSAGSAAAALGIKGASTVSSTNRSVWALLLPAAGPFSARQTREALSDAVDRRPLNDSGTYRPACGLFPAWVVGAETRDDCPPVPVAEAHTPLLGQSIRIAIPATAVPLSIGVGPGPVTTNPDGSTTPTTPEPDPAPLTVTTAAIEDLGGTPDARVIDNDPQVALAEGRADAALVRIRPSLPHPDGYLEPVAPLDALVQRGLPTLQARPLTGSSGAWSTLEQRVIARAVAIPLASEVETAQVGRAVEPRSVVLHPILGLDLAALRLR